jgi:hypothetical protein
VIEGLSKLIAHEVRYQERHVEKQWLLFCDQLRAEWEGASLDRVDSGKLYLTKGEKSLAFGKSVADDFRKTNANGQGYQPMLYKVYSEGKDKITFCLELITKDKELVTLAKSPVIDTTKQDYKKYSKKFVKYAAKMVSEAHGTKRSLVTGQASA